MENRLYEFDVSSGFHPYLGADVGVVDTRFKASLGPISLHESDTAFAHQGIGGIDYDLTDDVGLFSEYRFLRIVSLDFSMVNTPSDDEYAAHTLLVGVRWAFWSSPP